MIFSKACEYGIKATIHIATHSLDGHRTSLREIASEIGSPEAYTSKILQQLVRSGIIISLKGASGGFVVEPRNLRRLMLEDIVAAIDGKFNENICVLGMKACSQKNPCPVHDQYKHIKSGIRAMLQNTSLYEMCIGLKEGHTCLNF
jgi:Rrf2 family transcriptional regulator, iron-sulfur cluster assembly transcription factor